MKKATGLAAFLTLACLAAGILSQAEDRPGGTSTRPPRNLHQVGDHWTPWNPPDAGANDYIIQKGDTLWELGQQWLGNPFLWPQIWDQNRYVEDSHWIYPGDPLVRPGKTTVVPVAGPPPGEVGEEGRAQTAPAATTPARTREVAREVARPLMPLAWEHDVVCSGFIDADHTYPPTWISGREGERVGMATGDVVYISQGRKQGIEPGMDFLVRRRASPVTHPVTGHTLGDMVLRLGKVRVLCSQDDVAIGVIMDSCDPILESDELVPWKDIPVPNVTSAPPFERYCMSATGGPQGYVVIIKDDLDAAGKGHIIHTDLGADSGVRPGDFLALYRDIDEPPRRMLGQAVVLTVESTSSTAKIVLSVREVEPGDRAEVMRSGERAAR